MVVQVRVSIPDGGDGSRPPLLAEITTLTLYVYNVADGADLVGTSAAR